MGGRAGGRFTYSLTTPALPRGARTDALPESGAEKRGDEAPEPEEVAEGCGKTTLQAIGTAQGPRETVLQAREIVPEASADT